MENNDALPQSDFSALGLHVKMAWFRFFGKNSLVRCTGCGQDYVTLGHALDSPCRCCGGKIKFIRYTHEPLGMRK
jgi:rRNA maturation endonuclease Nob1